MTNLTVASGNSAQARSSHIEISISTAAQAVTSFSSPIKRTDFTIVAIYPPRQLTPSQQVDDIRGKRHYGSGHLSTTGRPSWNHGCLIYWLLRPSTTQEQWLWSATGMVTSRRKPSCAYPCTNLSITNPTRSPTVFTWSRAFWDPERWKDLIPVHLTQFSPNSKLKVRKVSTLLITLCPPYIPEQSLVKENNFDWIYTYLTETLFNLTIRTSLRYENFAWRRQRSASRYSNSPWVWIQAF